MPFRARPPPAPTAAQPARRGALIDPAEGGEQGGGGAHERQGSGVVEGSLHRPAEARHPLPQLARVRGAGVCGCAGAWN